MSFVFPSGSIAGRYAPSAELVVPFTIARGVSYLVALDRRVTDVVWSAAQNNINRVMFPRFHPPTKHGSNPVLGDGGIGDVYIDGSTWRYFYMSQYAYNGGDTESGIFHATSTNGTTWVYPDLDKYPTHTPTVQGEDNLAYTGPFPDRGAEGPVFIEAPPGADGRGYKYLCVYQTKAGTLGAPIRIVGTTNGVDWDDVNDLELISIGNDGGRALVPDTNGGWLLVTRLDAFDQSSQQAIDEGQGRRVGISHLPNLQTFHEVADHPVRCVLKVDEQDVLGGYQHIYSASCRRHESGLYIMLPHYFAAPDTINAGLAWSLDGRYWERPDLRYNAGAINFIEVGSGGAWDEGFIIPANNIYVENGDEWWFPYSGWDKAHSVQAQEPGDAEAQGDRRYVGLGFATMKKERIASYQGPATDDGFWSSRPLKWPGGELRINAAANGGSIRVRIMEANRRDPTEVEIYGPIVGYEFSNFGTFDTTDDEVEHTCTWTGGALMDDLAGQDIRIEVEMSNGADFFSFSAAPAP